MILDSYSGNIVERRSYYQILGQLSHQIISSIQFSKLLLRSRSIQATRALKPTTLLPHSNHKTNHDSLQPPPHQYPFNSSFIGCMQIHSFPIPQDTQKTSPKSCRRPNSVSNKLSLTPPSSLFPPQPSSVPMKSHSELFNTY